MKLYLRIILTLFCALMVSPPVFANGIDFSDSQGYFGVPSDNVGIGSSAPGQKLDVQGTVRTVNFTMSGQAPVSGYVLTAKDSAGDTTWSSAGGISGWTVTGNNVYETSGGNVGIGTVLLTNAALTVMNGNVGIGTWVPAGQLDIEGGNVGIGTSDRTFVLNVASPSSSTAFQINAINNNSSGNAYIRVTDNTTSQNLANFIINASGISSTGLTLIPLSAALFSGQGTTGGLVIDERAIGAPIIFGTGGNFFSNERMRIDGNGNVGIGTLNPVNLLDIAGGVGIGTGLNSTYVSTIAPSGGMIVQGNVGIGSLAPGQALDVQGTVRTVNFTMSGQAPVSGYVLTAKNSAGDTTWSSAGDVSGWTVTGNNVYETSGGNVGIGTVLLTNAALTVMNGNVGIGTWVPGSLLNIEGGNVGIGSNAPGQGLDVFSSIRVGNSLIFNNSSVAGNTIRINGVASINSVEVLDITSDGNSNPGIIIPIGSTNVGIGSYNPAEALDVAGNIKLGGGGAGGVFFGDDESAYIKPNSTTTPDLFFDTNNSERMRINLAGNVGIGSSAPGQKLDVQGTVRTVNFTMSGQAPVSGYVLTAKDSAGDTTWSSAGGVSGWTVTGNNVYETNGGNVGIGTNLLTNAALTVINGNVGIGTWIPAQVFQIGTATVNPDSGTGAAISSGGLMYLSDNFATAGSVVVGGNGNNEFTGGILTVYGNGSQAVIKNPASVSNSGLTLSGSESSNSKLIIQSTTVTGNGDSIAMQFGTNLGIGTTTVEMTEGNVGIGSTAPGQTLDVQGTVRTVNFTMSGQAPISGYVMTASDSAGDTTWSSPGGVSGWTESGNDVYETHMGNVGIGTVIINQAALTVMNGNVGIGTWVPSEPFQVIGSGVFGTGETVNNAFGGNLSNIIAGSNNSVSGYNSAVFGIGNTLGTNNNASFMAGNGNTIAGQSNAVIGTDVILNNSNQFSIGELNTLSNQFDMVYGTYVNTTADFAMYIGNGASNGNRVTNNTANSIMMGMNSTNPTVTITGGNGAAGIGNVGIGSTVPGQALDVQGTVRTKNFTMSSQSPIVGYVLTSSDSAGDALWSPLGGVAGVSGWTVSGTNVFKSNGGNVGIGTNLVTTAALTVMNGNVGIGTWVPGGALVVGATSGDLIDANNPVSETFHVTSASLLELAEGGTNANTPTIRIKGATLTNDTNDADLTFFDTNFTARDMFGLRYDDTTNNVKLNFMRDNGTTLVIAMTLDDNGNLGIGTTTPVGGLAVMNGNVGIGTWVPGAPLAIGGGANGAIQLTPGNPHTIYSTASQMWLGAGNVPQVEMGGSTLGLLTSYGPFLQGTGGATNNQVQLTGNVGIGTSTTVGALAVMSGNVGIGTWVPASTLDIIPAAAGQGILLHAANSSNFAAFLNTSGNLSLYSAGSQKTQLSSTDSYFNNGNVGIGTNIVTAGAALSVMNGNVGIGTWVPAYNLDLVNDTARERVVRRVNTVASSATPAINTDTTDLFTITALAANITSFTSGLTGTPINGDLLEIRILDNGTARTIAWGASFGSTSTTLPLTTVVSTTLRIILEYNSANSLWECIGVT